MKKLFIVSMFMLFIVNAWSQKYSTVSLSIMGFSGKSTRGDVISNLNKWNIIYEPFVDFTGWLNVYGEDNSKSITVKKATYAGIDWLWFVFHFDKRGRLMEVQGKADVPSAKFFDAINKLVINTYKFISSDAYNAYYYQGMTDDELVEHNLII